MNSQHKENSLDKTSTNKKTEEDLKKASAYLDAMGDALIVLDMEKKLIKFNTATLDLFGYSPEEISWISIDKLFPQKELEKHHTKMKEMLEDEEAKSFETLVLTKDGKEIPILLSGTLLKDDTGKPSAFVGMCKDITKQTITQKIKDQAKFISENPNPVLRIHKNGEVLYSNKAGKSLLTKWESGVGKTVPEKWRNLIAEALNSKNGKKEEEEEVEHKTFLLNIVPVKNAEYVNLYASDITKRKQFETKLKHTAEEWKTTFDSITDPVSIHNKDFKIIRANKSFAHVFNMEPNEIVGKFCYELIHGTKEPPSFCPHKQTLDTGKPNCAEFFEPNLGIHIEASVSPIFDEDGRVIASTHIAKDITERKQVEEQLKLSRDQANAANEAKNQFLANISHEIRTPMNAVIGFSDILSDERLTYEQKDYVNIIHNCGKHLMQIIDDILDFSKIESGNLDVEMIDCSLEELLNRVESILQHQVSEKGLEFQIRKDDRLPAIIHTDSNRIQQCLTNLVSNAIKFTETGYIYVNVSLEDKDNQPFIRFDVEDTGIGIPTEKKDKIFESFTQADGSTSRKYGGTGLGLPITRHLAKLLGGKLSLTSEEGKGSIFSLVIPAGIDVKKQSLEDRGNVEAHIDTAEDKTQQLKLSGHVLVAEDVETNQMLVKSLLNRMNLEVTIAADGKETVEKALAEKFDLILMDIQMPHMNGCEATKKLREEGIKTPIVALTANALKGDREKCISAGCDDYLPKPIDRQQLMEKILKYLPQENQNLNGPAEHPGPATEQAAEQIQLNESIVPSEEIIDWDQLIDRLGDEELIKEVVSIFLEDNKERFDKLCEAVKSKNSSEIKFYAHAIKGIAINIGAKQLSDIACRLECADMQNDTREATLLFDKLKTELEKVVAFLSRTNWIEIVKSGKTITNERLKANI